MKKRKTATVGRYLIAYVYGWPLGQPGREPKPVDGWHVFVRPDERLGSIFGPTTKTKALHFAAIQHQADLDPELEQLRFDALNT